MSLSLAIILMGMAIYKASSTERKKKIRHFIATLVIFLIIIRTVYVYICGANLLYELPLHLCSIAGILCFVYEYGYNVLPQTLSDYLGQGLLSVCLVGALLAIIFSDGTMYPAFHFITIQSNLYHTLIVLYILICTSDHVINGSIRHAYKGIVFLIVLVPPIMLFDMHFRTNYMFLLGPSIGSPLTFAFEDFGYIGYLIVYGAIAIIEIYAVNYIVSRVQIKFSAS